MTESVPKQPLRICQSCRSITSADQAQCANCGAVSADIATVQHEAMREQEFARAFFSRESPFTWIFFGVNIGIYLLTCFASGPEPHVLIAMGAKVIWSFASIYLLTVSMRILGLLYITRKDKLGWFSH